MGRPMLYPRCTKCGKAVKPDQAGDALDIHKRCPGTIDPNANGMTPLERARAAMALKRAEAKAAGVPLMRKSKELKEEDRLERLETVGGSIGGAVVRTEPIAEPVVVKKERKAKTVEKFEWNNDPDAPLNAREVEHIIRDTVGHRDRYVVKHENKFYLTDDPEKGFAGEGYNNPSVLLMDFLKTVGFLRDSDGDVMAYIKR